MTKTLQHIHINAKITAPVITEAMRLALLISIAKQLGATINEQETISLGRGSYAVTTSE